MNSIVRLANRNIPVKYNEEVGFGNLVVGKMIWWVTLAWVWIVSFAVLYLIFGRPGGDLLLVLGVSATCFTLICAALYRARLERIKRGRYRNRANRLTTYILLPVFSLAWLVAFLSFIPSVVFLVVCLFYYCAGLS